jgi:hypothetical protein
MANITCRVLPSSDEYERVVECADMRAGEWVEVRSKEEILATLDKDGRLEGLPFMPEMLQFCGRRFPVYKSAHKTCDTVSGRYVGLSVARCVHLEHRCDGRYHGNCQAGCLLFWKEAWLKPLDGADCADLKTPSTSSCTEADLSDAARTQQDGEPVYSCQATALLQYARPLKWWDPRQYAEAYRSRNRSASEVMRGLTYLFFYYALGRYPRFGAPWRWLYDKARPLWGGVPFPRRKGRIPLGQLVPRADLGLKPGDLVRVKSYEQILATLDQNSSSRGLAFDAELVPYCGKVYRVKTRVHQFVDERTGKLRRLKTPAVILDRVVCKGRYSGQRMFCPREIYLWWREIWLERIGPSASEYDAPKRDTSSERPMTTEVSL